ncbi:Ser/Thr protein kinase RdoA involved in Cpx stress response, MazF antagonist [Nocardioides exalbidus]|uniref:Ser/Thr protein kinase RdoA involved in Cpx stress response, MazF antagonist n=1 Tax=Nocardioides exalbidus TaxID=402596 RepID=A0A1H4XAW6_9ACTN|nr:phosphotransferase [Nocardioides exalbidus]SED02719.1 Ser/Thr protein kinase RdoA involved in Cpx stress response, MazF antagonist [Nocardioides exalbidus]
MDDAGSSLTPLAGGWSGRTFLGEAGGERVVVRLYPPDDPRGPEAPEVDQAVLHLVRGLLPVPDVLEVRRPRPGTGEPGLLVTGWLPGERGDVVVGRLEGEEDADGLRRLGGSMGTVAATLAGMPVRRPGTFLDAELALGDLPDVDLPEWADHRLAGWSSEERGALAEVARDAQDLLDTVGRASLVHSDLNPKNVLVGPGSLVVTAVLDWEFAHAGHPWTDVGNLLRFERHPAYVEGVLAAWTGLRGGTAEDLLDGARAADLWALVDLAARAGDNPVADRAAVLVRAVADSGDLHAWPF